MEILKKNKRYYAIYNILKRSFMIWTVFLIYLEDKGFSFTEIMLLNSISAIVTFILEVPSGAIADIFGRKKSILWGEVLNTISLFIVFITNSYSLLVLNAILSGAGDALVSGAGTALIYESFEREGKKEEYKSYIAKVFKWGFRCSATMVLFSGALYKQNVNIPILVSIVFSIVAILSALSLQEDIKKSDENKNIKEEMLNQFKVIEELIKSPQIMKIFGVYVVMTIIVSNINYLSQTYLRNIGIDVFYFGGLYFVFQLISSFGAKKAESSNFKKMSYMMIGYSIVLIGLSVSNNYFGIMFFMCSRYLDGMVWPTLDADLNEKIENKSRATVLSYKSLVMQIAFIVFDPIIGIMIDKTSVHKVYLILGTSVISIFVLVNLFKKFRKNRKLEANAS